MRETQQSICEWADATFGVADYTPRIFARANEELAELIKGLTQVQALAPVVYDPTKLVEEAADTAIILCRLARKAGLDHADGLMQLPAHRSMGPLIDAIHAAFMLLGAMERVVTKREEINSTRTQGSLILVIQDLTQVCHALGGSLADGVDAKMTINRAREWNLDNTGHGYHR